MTQQTNEQPATSLSKQFALRHVFRAGAIVWCKHRGKDYYVVFKSHTRPNRGTQLPGGRIERNENFAETILREVKEESGLETRIICPLGYIFFENPVDNYSNMQFYYIVRPVYPVDVFKKWQFIDEDMSKQELEVWCVSADKDPSFLSAGQDQVVRMFQKWLKDHKKEPRGKGKKFTKHNKYKKYKKNNQNGNQPKRFSDVKQITH